MDYDNQKRFNKAPRKLCMTTTPLFQRMKDAERKIVVSVGGAGSSKTHSAAQLCIERLLFGTSQRILVQRKHMPALRVTAMQKIIDILTSGIYDVKSKQPVDIYSYCEHSKTQNLLKFNDNIIEFKGLDNPEKAKSTEYNCIWWEEANQFTWDDYVKTITRGLRHPALGDYKNKAYLTLNPEDSLCWIKAKLEDTGLADVIHSTYHDNPTLDEDNVKDLEALKDTDYDYWLVFAKGEYASMRNQVYRPFQQEDKFPEGPFDETIYGVDFGWRCTAVVRLDLMYSDDKNLPDVYLTEVIHQGIAIKDSPKGLTHSELINKLKNDLCRAGLVPKEHVNGVPWYCDHADPAAMEEMRQGSFWVKAADKDRKNGIDFCKRLTFHILNDNIHINRERSLYKYRTDANGVVIDDDPLKENDHALDAIRYAAYTHISPIVNWRPGITVSEDFAKKKKRDPSKQNEDRYQEVSVEGPAKLTKDDRAALFDRPEIWETNDP